MVGGRRQLIIKSIHTQVDTYLGIHTQNLYLLRDSNDGNLGHNTNNLQRRQSTQVPRQITNWLPGGMWLYGNVCHTYHMQYGTGGITNVANGCLFFLSLPRLLVNPLLCVPVFSYPLTNASLMHLSILVTTNQIMLDTYRYRASRQAV